MLAIESRGFIFGAPLALALGLPLHLVRKRGKLPRAALTVRYELEYGFDHLEMHADAIRRGGRYLIVDDVIATGGTAAAVASVVAQQGGDASRRACSSSSSSSSRGREKLARPRPSSSLITVLRARAQCERFRMNSDSHMRPSERSPERAQRADGALLRLGRASARAFDAERRRIGRLVVAGVAAGVLAERRRVLLDLEQVVADLKHEADVAREHVEVRALLGAQARRARSAS